uniref:Uncharacterized protein n=1 Tax=Lactuca sativa TaxID=4236 RepID=A0A9R1WY32_LACSA|nr:hypothetical protein LSAT_V11C800449780 [Lactuca sativa]
MKPDSNTSSSPFYSFAPKVSRTTSSFSNGKMTTSSAGSSFNGGSIWRNKKVIKCKCGDVYGGSYGFYKWMDEELDREMEMSNT